MAAMNIHRGGGGTAATGPSADLFFFVNGVTEDIVRLSRSIRPPAGCSVWPLIEIRAPYSYGLYHIVMAYIVMAYTVMAYPVMAYIVMAYTVMAYVVMASGFCSLAWP